MYANALLSIDMDADELQNIGELLVETYSQHNLIRRVQSTRSVIFSKIKVFSYNLLQLIGVTLSLIAANVFSPLIGSLVNSAAQSTTGITLPVVQANTYSKFMINP